MERLAVHPAQRTAPGTVGGPETPSGRHERYARGVGALTLLLDVASEFDVVSVSMTGYTVHGASGEIRLHLGAVGDAVVLAGRLGLGPADQPWGDDDHHTWRGRQDGWDLSVVATGPLTPP